MQWRAVRAKNGSRAVPQELDGCTAGCFTFTRVLFEAIADHVEQRLLAINVSHSHVSHSQIMACLFMPLPIDSSQRRGRIIADAVDMCLIRC